MRKLLTTVVLVVMSIAVAVMPAFAGSHHGGSGNTVRYYVCSTKNCSMTGLHMHGSQYYNAHFYGDGHNYHASHGKGHSHH